MIGAVHFDCIFNPMDDRSSLQYPWYHEGHEGWHVSASVRFEEPVLFGRGIITLSRLTTRPRNVQEGVQSALHSAMVPCALLID